MHILYTVQCVHVVNLYMRVMCNMFSLPLSPSFLFLYSLSLSSSGYSYERLDGSVRGEERFLAVQNFSKDEDTFIFLLSTRAGHQ